MKITLFIHYIMYPTNDGSINIVHYLWIEAIVSFEQISSRVETNAGLLVHGDWAWPIRHYVKKTEESLNTRKRTDAISRK